METRTLPGFVQVVDLICRSLDDLSNIGLGVSDTLHCTARHLLFELSLHGWIVKIHTGRSELGFANTDTRLDTVLKHVHFICKISMELLEILGGVLLASFDSLIIVSECIETFELELSCLLTECNYSLLN